MADCVRVVNEHGKNLKKSSRLRQVGPAGVGERAKRIPRWNALRSMLIDIVLSLPWRTVPTNFRRKKDVARVVKRRQRQPRNLKPD